MQKGHAGEITHQPGLPAPGTDATADKEPGDEVNEISSIAEDDQIIQQAEDDSRAVTPSVRLGWGAYLRITLYLLLAVTILGFTGRMFWWADYFAHPRMHLAVAIGALSCVFLIMGDWLRLAAAAVGVLLNLMVMNAAISGGNNTYNAMVMPPGQLKVITLNVNGLDPSGTAFPQWLTAEQPDIVVLIEANRAWLPQLDKLISALPYQKMADHTTSYGIAILSRFPMDKLESSVAGPRSLPSLTAEMETPLGRIAVMGVHPNPPGDGADTRSRDLYLAQLAAIAQTTSMPTLMVGDFNATPWSSGFETIRLLPNLQPASSGMPPTWPASFGPLGLPTEHVLLTIPYDKPRAISFHGLTTGPAIPGASHLPLIADIRVDTDEKN